MKDISLLLNRLNQVYPYAKCELNYKNNFQLLISIMLSAQTTDKKVNEITKELFKYTTNQLANKDLGEIELIIKPLGLYKAKAISIKEIAKKSIPKTVEKLINLKGVGRKTALAYLHEAHNINEGLVVDTHVKKFAKFFNLTKEIDPLKIENDLKKIIPSINYRQFTHLVIAHGRECKYKKKDCLICSS